MNRVCFLNKIEISRIIFNVIRKELNLENELIQRNPYNSCQSRCLVLMENKTTQVLAVSTIYDGLLHFTIDVYRKGYRVNRVCMFGPYGCVGYNFTRNEQKEFEKDCAAEFWNAYEQLPKFLR